MYSIFLFIFILVNKKISKETSILKALLINKLDLFMLLKCLGSYHVECTGSRPITEVKQRRARLVLG